MLKKLFIISIVMIILLPNILAIPFFDSSFTLRQEYNLTANYSVTDTTFFNLTNYTAYLSFDTATLIAAEKLNSDCSDLRVVDAKTNEELNFEIEQGTCNSSLGTPLFIRFPVLNHENFSVANNIHIYYNNSAATFKSNEFSQQAWDRRYKSVWHISNDSLINSVTGQISSSDHTTIPPTSEISIGNMLNITGGGAGDVVPFSQMPHDFLTNVTLEAVHVQRIGLVGDPCDNNERYLIMGGFESGNGQNGIGGQCDVLVTNRHIYATRRNDLGIEVGEFDNNPYDELHYSVGNFFQTNESGGIAVYIFDGVVQGQAESIQDWRYSGGGRDVELNGRTGFAAAQGFRGEITEVRISNNFTQTLSVEYAQINSNLFLDNSNFWIIGSEESLPTPPVPPPITGQVAFETTGTSGILVRAGSIAMTLVILLGLFLELVFKPIRSKLKGK